MKKNKQKKLSENNSKKIINFSNKEKDLNILFKSKGNFSFMTNSFNNEENLDESVIENVEKLGYKKDYVKLLSYLKIFYNLIILNSYIYINFYIYIYIYY